jgi:ribonuclease Z
MSHRELVVLGTASQVPTRYRNHNSYFLRWDADGFLFDPGEGTQRQLTFADLSASQIHFVCISHFHGDHALGLPGILQRLSLDRAPHPIHTFFPASGRMFYERLRHATIYHDVAEIVPHPITKDGPVFETKTWTLYAHRLDHGVETYGYSVREKDGHRMLPEKLAALGIRGPQVGALLRDGSVEIEGRTVTLAEASEPRPGQRFGFVMDTRPCAGGEWLAERADLLVSESTYLSSESSEAWDHYHMTAAQAGVLARKAGARRLVLTHFSQRYHDSGAFQREAAGEFAGEIRAVSDLDRVALPARLP